MSWTEPICHCGGSGADGCQPLTMTAVGSDVDIDRLRTAIAGDAARAHGLIDAIERDVQRLRQHRDAVTVASQPTADTNHSAPRALPAPSITDNLWEHLTTKEETVA